MTKHTGLFATQEMRGCHPNPFHADYPLLPGDLLVKREDGTYGKVGPGLGIEGFVLTAEQEATLETREFGGIEIVGMEEFAASCGVELRRVPTGEPSSD